MNHNMTEPRTTPTDPPPKQPTKSLHREGREQTPMTRAKTGGGGTAQSDPHTTHPADCNTARKTQGRTTTKVEEWLLHRTGQAGETADRMPAAHKTATHSSRGDASRQASVRRIPTSTTHGASRAKKAGYERDTTREPDQEVGSYAPTHTRATTATHSRKSREVSNAPTLIPSTQPNPQTAPPPGRRRVGQPLRSRNGCYIGRGKLAGQLRERSPHTKQLHTPAGETPADRRA